MKLRRDEVPTKYYAWGGKYTGAWRIARQFLIDTARSDKATPSWWEAVLYYVFRRIWYFLVVAWSFLVVAFVVITIISYFDRTWIADTVESLTENSVEMGK